MSEKKTRLQQTTLLWGDYGDLEPAAALASVMERGPDPCSLRVQNDASGEQDEVVYVLYVTGAEIAALCRQHAGRKVGV